MTKNNTIPVPMSHSGPFKSYQYKTQILHENVANDLTEALHFNDRKHNDMTIATTNFRTSMAVTMPIIIQLNDLFLSNIQ